MTFTRMKSLLVFSISCLLSLNLSAQNLTAKEPITVPSVDFSRYAGTWCETARLPNPCQDKCVGDVRARYTLRDDGTINVVNR